MRPTHGIWGPEWVSAIRSAVSTGARGENTQILSVNVCLCFCEHTTFTYWPALADTLLSLGPDKPHFILCGILFFMIAPPEPTPFLHTHTDRGKPGHGGTGRLVIASTSPHVKVGSLASRRRLAETLSPPYRAPQERLCHYPQIVEDEMKRMSKSEAQGLWLGSGGGGGGREGG